MKGDASMHLCTYIHSYTTWNNIIWITTATYFKCAIIKSIPRWVLNWAYSWCLLNTANSIRSKSVKELYIVTAYIWKYTAFRICIWSAKHQEHHSNYKHTNITIVLLGLNFLTILSGLKPGQVIQVTFYQGQAGLTRFTKYPGLIWILH